MLSDYGRGTFKAVLHPSPQAAGAIVELGLLTALLYLAMSYPLSVMTNRLEKKLNQERRG